MKIGIIASDGHNFPNLALMKLANYHRRNGDIVEWVNYFERYDKVYQSKVFTFTPDVTTVIQSDVIIKGGTGYKMYDDLFCDDAEPDYSLYPQFESAYGFLTRGCMRNCAWCIVPKKEGGIRAYRDIETVLQGRKTAILMDNNVLASEHGLQQLEKIADLKCKVDFNQGLDCRLVTDEVAKLLSKIRWIRHIRFSCDTLAMIDPLINAINKLNKYGIKNYKIFVYVLVKDIEDANKRCSVLKKMGVMPFAQPYRDFTGKSAISIEQVRFANYVNCPQIFKTIEFKDYKTNKNKQLSPAKGILF
jgi:hypothetical protein